MLLETLTLDHLRGSVTEALAADHFETFEFTQDLPFGVLTLVGRDSWFVYGLDPAPHARAGKRTAEQEARRLARAHRGTRGGYTGSFLRGLDLALPLVPEGKTLIVACDGKTQYLKAHEQHARRRRIELAVHPNPKRGAKGSGRSPEALERDRALYPVDQFHALLRHSRADHKRETIAFGRRLNAIMERLFVAAAWRNFVKGRSERHPDRTTPAMRLGLTQAPWTWSRLLSRRLFRNRLSLPPTWRDLYERTWTSPVLGRNTRHDLRHAA